MNTSLITEPGTRQHTSTSFDTFGRTRCTQQVATHRDSSRAAVTAPQRSETRNLTDDPFRARFGKELPQGLRDEARGMDWRTFTATYAPAPTVAVRHLESTRLRMGKFRFEADINGAHKEIIATGPVSACTNLLADAGRRIEILKFHQYEIFEATVTFIYTCHNNDYAWAMGFGPTRDLSAAQALSAAGERLHGKR